MSEVPNCNNYLVVVDSDEIDIDETVTPPVYLLEEVRMTTPTTTFVSLPSMVELPSGVVIHTDEEFWNLGDVLSDISHPDSLDCPEAHCMNLLKEFAEC